MQSYIGNGAYCYANSTAMLLAAQGEEVSPALIEVLTGVGLGAMWLPDAPTLLLSAFAPDVGISAALAMLGFAVTEQAFAEDAPLPLAALRAALAVGPVVLGPLDMGELTYMPEHDGLHGVDHYVYAYALEDSELVLHDPAEFPCVRLGLAALERAWRAERIAYRRGAFRFWRAPRRLHHPDSATLHTAALVHFRQIYPDSQQAASVGMVMGPQAIHAAAQCFTDGTPPAALVGALSHFTLPVGAKRALDYAAFFQSFASSLAEQKWQQAQILGAAQTAVTGGDWPRVATMLRALAQSEARFAEAMARE